MQTQLISFKITATLLQKDFLFIYFFKCSFFQHFVHNQVYYPDLLMRTYSIRWKCKGKLLAFFSYIWASKPGSLQINTILFFFCVGGKKVSISARQAWLLKRQAGTFCCVFFFFFSFFLYHEKTKGSQVNIFFSTKCFLKSHYTAQEFSLSSVKVKNKKKRLNRCARN